MCKEIKKIKYKPQSLLYTKNDKGAYIGVSPVAVNTFYL